MGEWEQELRSPELECGEGADPLSPVCVRELLWQLALLERGLVLLP